MRGRLPRALGAVLAVVLTMPTAVGAVGVGVGAEADVVVRPEVTTSMKIEGDAELANHPAVRSGSGTVEDPYRIADWVVMQDQVYGIWLANVTSHVVIERVAVDGSKLTSTAALRCVTETGGCGPTEGLFLENVDNVSVRDVRLSDQFRGVVVSDSGSVEMQRVELGFPLTRSLNPALNTTTHASAFTRGIDIDDTEELGIDNVTIGDAEVSFSARRVDELRAVNSTINGRGSTAFLEDVNETRISTTSFSKVQIRIDEAAQEVSVTRSEFTEVFEAIRVDTDVTPDPPLEAVDVCGTVIQNTWGGEALSLQRTKSVDVVATSFMDAGGGIMANEASEGIRVVRSSITNTSGRALTLHGAAMEVHNNAIADNEAASVLHADERGDASYNWWGDAEGPNITSREGPGDGDELWPPLNVTLRPFLDAPPKTGPNSVDCGTGQSDPSVERSPQLGIAAEASLAVHAER